MGVDRPDRTFETIAYTSPWHNSKFCWLTRVNQRNPKEFSKTPWNARKMCRMDKPTTTSTKFNTDTTHDGLENVSPDSNMAILRVSISNFGGRGNLPKTPIWMWNLSSSQCVCSWLFGGPQIFDSIFFLVLKVTLQWVCSLNLDIFDILVGGFNPFEKY